jgi:gliding motility-associated-like protein
MKKKILFLSLFIFLGILLFSQTNSVNCFTCVQTPASSKSSKSTILNANQGLATSYTRTACGLNYVYASNPLFQRTGNNFTLSLSQPASFSLSGIPTCAVIEKAFLYVGVAGDSTAFGVNIVNPGLGNSIFAMPVVGSGPDKNWGFVKSYTYRGDVTNIISGNGSYTISGIPTSTSAPGNDANGALLIVIYSDRSQDYSGSIVLADGMFVNTAPGGSITATISNFDVCGTPSLSTNFMLVDDMQQYDTTEISFNSAVPNYTLVPTAQLPWSFLTTSISPVMTLQTSADFGLINAKDSIGVLMAGMYFQSDCLICPEPLNIVASSTPSCLATASVAVTGGVGPYTYTWTGTAQTTATVSGLSAGIQTVIVADNQACLIDTMTFNVVTPAATITATPGTLCVGYSTPLSVGSAVSYTWNPSATIDAPNSQNVVASPLTTTDYTVEYTDALGCTNEQIVQAVVTLTQTIANSTISLCLGGPINLSTNSFTGDAYFWSGPLGYTSTLQNPIILNSTNPMAGAYNLTVTTIPGCTTTAVSSVNVSGLPNPVINNNSPLCVNANLNFTGSGGSTYSWAGPNGFTSSAQNPTVVGVTLADAGTYSLTASFGNGCSKTATANVVVNSLPAPSIISGTNVCVGNPVIFTGLGGGTYQWSGPNSFTSALASPSIGALTLAGNGVYSLTVTNGNNCKATATQTVIALISPTAAAISPTSCYGSPATFTVVGAGFYEWFGPNNFNPPANFTSTITVPVADVLSIGVYTVVLTTAINSCSANATATLFARPVPTVSATGTLVCLNSPATLTASGGINYNWQGPGTYTFTGVNALVAAANASTTGIYSVVVTAPNTCTALTTTTLGTIQLPTVTATGTLLCLNEPFTMNAGGASTYTWSGPSSYSVVGASAYVPVVNALSTGVYTVLGRAPNSCTNVTTATLSTLPLPVITTTGAAVCINQPAFLLAAGGLTNTTGYTWRGPSGYLSYAQNAQILSATNVSPQTFTVVGTGANSCTNIAFATLSTYPLPNIFAAGATVCYGYPANLNANGAVTYTWAGPNSNNFSGSSTNFIPVADSLSRGVYTVYGTSFNGCVNQATANLATIQVPTITTSGATVCIFQSATITASGGVSGSYQWFGPGGYTSASQNPVFVTATNVIPATYTVVASGLNTCTASAIAVLKTYPLPKPSYNATATVCMGDNVIIQGLGAITYTWTGPRRYEAFTKDISFPTFNPAQAGIYTLNVIDINGCKNFTTALVTINLLPEGSLSSDNNGKYCVPFCSDFIIKRTTISPIITSEWSVNNNIIVSETFNYCKTFPGTDKITGKFTDAVGCVSTLTFAINGYAVPVAGFTVAPERPLESNDQVQLLDFSTGDQIIQWTWSFAYGKTISTDANTFYFFEDSGDYPVQLKVENIWGCKDSTTKIIQVDTDPRLFVPNSFTPDYDGLNDVFQPEGRGIVTYDLQIYNRKNQKIFQSMDFETGWDGIYFGEKCPNDIYVWKISALDVRGKKYDLSGTLTLLR